MIKRQFIIINAAYNVATLVMFEHSQQVEHLGTSSGAVRKLFQELATPARPFQLQQKNMATKV